MPSPTPLSVSGERPRVENRSGVNVQARQVGTRHPVTFQVLNVSTPIQIQPSAQKVCSIGDGF